MRRVVPVLCVLACASAAAAEPGARLSVNGSACEAGLVERRVVALMGTDPFARDAIDATPAMVVDIAATASGVTARVRTADGERQLDAPTCAAAADSIAVVIAMAIRAAARARADAVDAWLAAQPLPPPEQIRDDETPPAPGAPPPRDPPPPPAPAAWLAPELFADAPPLPRHTSVRVIVASAVDIADGRPRGQLAAGVEVRHGAASLGAEVHVEAAESVAIGPMSRIAVRRTSGALAPCAHLGPVAACGLAIAGAIHGTSTGLFEARDAWSPSISLGGRLAYERALGAHAAVRLHFDVDAPLTTTRFYVDQADVWSNPRVEVWTGVGLAARFP